MGTVQEQLTVESITKFGIRSNGKSYSISPRLKDSGTTPDKFQKGATYLAEVYTGPQGGKSINSFSLVGLAGLPGVIASAPFPSPVPSLPPTTTQETMAPKGVAPIAPANKAVVDPEKMSKNDWLKKDEAIETVAIIKSSIESGVMAQLAVGKKQEEVFATQRAFIKYNLETLELAKQKAL